MNNPSPQFPAISQRGKPPLKGKTPRVHFGSCMVEPETKAWAFRWIQLGLLSKGELLDAMRKHCDRTGFALTRLPSILTIEPKSNTKAVSFSVNKTSKITKSNAIQPTVR